MLPRTDSSICNHYLPISQHTFHDEESKRLYFELSSRQVTQQALDEASVYLQRQLQTAEQLEAEFPADKDDLLGWMRTNARKVGEQYEAYLQRRRAGASRQYFSSKSHALNFLQGVAPTKLVDGSWLYGLTRHWRDDRYLPLVQTYLEELGDGMPEKNHVVLYKKLLAAHGCEQWQSLDDNYFVQGAIQLALAYHADRFLPEVIGFNLGYEQLPLHLLITAYELNELDIDPYYFTLHVTIDNVSTGHAQKAVHGLLGLLPQLADQADFYRRVANGYKLNMLGASTNSVIAAFDLDEEIIKILRDKSSAGRHMHSDFCRIGGRTVNQWLADEAQISDFLHSLEQSGWIQRHQDPANSRFWRLLEGERAEMFGVFTAYEKQVIHDWIAGEANQQASSRDSNSAAQVAKRPQLSFRARQRLLRTLEPRIAEVASVTAEDEADVDVQLLEQQLALAQSRNEMMHTLADLMSPGKHHTPCGLMATRIFNWMLDRHARAA